MKITEKHQKCTKKVENTKNEVFQPAFGCMQHPKAGLNTHWFYLKAGTLSYLQI